MVGFVVLSDIVTSCTEYGECQEWSAVQIISIRAVLLRN